MNKKTALSLCEEEATLLIVADTSGIVALLNADDQHHLDVLRAFEAMENNG